MRTSLAATLACLAVALLSPTAAYAHAEFVAADPAPGTTLEHDRPRAVSISFYGPVDPRTMQVAVTGSDGARIDTGPVRAVPYDPTTLSVALRGRLRGTYRVDWRTVSPDGHAVAGTYGFAVGAPSAGAPAPEQEQAVPAAPPLANAASAVARAAQDGALALAFGLLVFLLLVWRRAEGGGEETGTRRAASEAVETRLHRLAVAAAVVGAASALGAVLAQGAVVTSGSGFGAITSLPDVAASRAGLWWTVACAGWIAVLVAVRRRPDGIVAAGLLGLLIIATPLRGHGGGSALGLLIAVHVAAVAAWLGGLVALLVAERTAAGRLSQGQRLSLLGALVRRFGAVALPCAAIVLVTGAVQALIALDGPDQLATTGYGRLVGVKLLVLAGLLALAARNRLVLQARLALPGGVPAAAALRRVVTAELTLAGIALAAAGLLAGSAPPS